MRHFFKTILGAFIGTLLALFAIVFITVGIFGSIAGSGSSEPSVPKSTILKIDLSTPLADQDNEDFNFDPLGGSADFIKTTSLLKTINAIDAAAEDPSVKFIYMLADNSASSISTMEELREALTRFRASGKAIVSYSKNLSSGIYYMASVADKVILNPYGNCIMQGMGASMMYYKDLIDYLGIDVQLIRHGKYKSAGEPYIKSEMSKENREQYEVLLGTMWNTIVDGIASSRDFTAEDFNGWVDELKIFTPRDAKDLGVVDELWFDDQVDEYLCSLFDVKEAKDLKFTSVADYADAKVKPDGKIREKIAVVYAGGEIVSGNSEGGAIGENFMEELSKVRRDSSVKAVVLRVNSPGGVVQTAAEISREIELLKEVKPVIASYGGYAASGGYWISCNCDKIFSDRSTLTGSIGVFGLIPSFGRAIKKNLHLNTFEVSTAKHGSFVNGFTPLDEEEVAVMQGSIEDVYSDFVSRVSAGRDIPEERVDEIAQGRVWAGGDALTIGLVDEIGGLKKAIEYAASAADLEQYRVVEYPVVKSFIDRLTESFNSFGSKSETKVKAGNDSGAATPYEEAGALLKNLSEPQVVARMDNIIIK